MSSGGRSELGTRFIFGPLMLGLIALIYYADLHWISPGENRGYLSAGVLGLLGLGGLHEFIGMFRKAGFAIAPRLLYVFAIGLFGAAFAFWWGNVDRELYPVVIATTLMLFPISLVSLTRSRMERGLELQGGTLLAFILVAWPIYFGQGIALRHLPSLLFVILVCKGGDIGGYLAGVSFGKHKLIPHISGGKTIEGALGSLLASVLLSVFLAPVILEPQVQLPGLTAAIGMGIMLNVTTQCGDLIESLLKRRCATKDSSSLLPAHGGILDLIDSLLFSFPAYFLALTVLT